MNKLVFVIVFLLLKLPLLAQLDVNVYTTPEEMVRNHLLGESIKAMNVSYAGHIQSRASFSNQNTVVSFQRGIVLSSGYVTAIPGNNKSSSFSGSMGEVGDLDLSRIAAGESVDAAVLEFDFVAKSEMVSFRYVFASEEYPEYVNSQFNDVFAFYLTDKETKQTWNLATIPTTNTPISINTINDKWNFKYYISNLPQSINKFKYDLEMIEMDGLTKPLVAYHPVTKGKIYHIKIAICDVGDANLDSSVFLEGGSFISQSEEEFYQENGSFINDFEESKSKTPRKPRKRQKEKLEEKEEVLIETQDTAAVEVEETVVSLVKQPKELVLYFDSDQHTLSPLEKGKLQNFMLALNHTKGEWNVTGYTDNDGSDSYNIELSKKRAQAVAEILQSDSEMTCIIAWKGEGNPLNANSSNKEKSLNRRVVVQFKPK